MPTIRSGPPPITATPALQIATTTDKHRQRRIFVGPMPDHVVADRETQTRLDAKNKRGWFRLRSHVPHHGQQDPVADVVQDYAYQFYVDRGGREEDWSEQEERRITDVMLKRWRETPWGARWSRRNGDPGVKGHWIGDSFEVGDFLGMNILHGEPLRSTKSISTTNLRPNAASGDTYTTARSHASGSARSSSQISESPELGPDTDELPHRDNELPQPSSSTELLRPAVTVHADEHPAQTHSEAPRPILKDAPPAQAKSDGAIGGVRVSSFRRDKGKARVTDKTVHYVGSPSTPAPPSDVLERTGSEMDGTSAGAAETQITEISSFPALQESVPPDEIIMQGNF
ncbi:hypothetical protein EWM64_g4907 [Hericium alpestre]|uniref:Uncharacterized protein n=1 Tax=Hericium alpestre TaxID=135208 RepID=A0A4Y9ZY29_9AGAM|nr:hypothetical protein EWM64_g4907 [Hericium alpestre]